MATAAARGAAAAKGERQRQSEGRTEGRRGVSAGRRPQRVDRSLAEAALGEAGWQNYRVASAGARSNNLPSRAAEFRAASTLGGRDEGGWGIADRVELLLL